MSSRPTDDEREWAADRREFVADRRDEIAAGRDAVAETREAIADVREATLDEWERRLVDRSAELKLRDVARRLTEAGQFDRNDIGRSMPMAERATKRPSGAAG